MKLSPLKGLIWLIALALVAAIPANAGETGELYQAATIVTGERDETRYPGIRECFERMMQKVSGNPDIIQRPGFSDVAARSRGMVWSYTYHDRMFGRPLGDEQGTRDRPFDLTVQFEQKMVDEALASLGSKPWPEPRPKLVVVVGVRDMVRSYMLASDEPHGSDMRDAFADASARFAMPIVFATTVDLTGAALSFDALARPNAAQLQDIARKVKADHILAGRIEWVAKEHGWHANWTVADVPASAPWQISGVNFDAAFRSAIGGAAHVLSTSGSQ